MTRAGAAAEDPPCLVQTLPSHVLQEVLGFLGAADVARAAMTCAAFRQASRSEHLWRRLLSALGQVNGEPAWKAIFKFWSDPQPNSLAWQQSLTLDEGTFAARYLHRCTAIGVSAPRASYATYTCPQYDRHKMDVVAGSNGCSPNSCLRRDGAIVKLTRRVTAPNPCRTGTRS